MIHDPDGLLQSWRFQFTVFGYSPSVHLTLPLPFLACSWFIQIEHSRVPKEGHGQAETALHPPAERGHLAVGRGCEIDLRTVQEVSEDRTC